MSSFICNIIYSFLISLGVILGASFFSGVGALINNHPPLKTMMDLASSIKIWAVATALGGTFSSFEVIEGGIFKGEIGALIKQILYILSAMLGVNLGLRLLKLIEKCGEIWVK